MSGSIDQRLANRRGNEEQAGDSMSGDLRLDQGVRYNRQCRNSSRYNQAQSFRKA